MAEKRAEKLEKQLRNVTKREKRSQNSLRELMQAVRESNMLSNELQEKLNAFNGTGTPWTSRHTDRQRLFCQITIHGWDTLATIKNNRCHEGHSFMMIFYVCPSLGFKITFISESQLTKNHFFLLSSPWLTVLHMVRRHCSYLFLKTLTGPWI